MLKRGHIICCIITLGLGTLMHYFYEFSGNNPVVGALSPVNESTWEHLKMLYIPMFFCTVAEFFIYKKRASLFPVRALCASLGCLLIVSLFYTYTGIIGTNFLIADISTFVIAVIFSYVLGYKLMLKGIFKGRVAVIVGCVCLIGVLLLFVAATFAPPQIPLFLAP